jgi:hypothetical protein
MLAMTEASLGLFFLATAALVLLSVEIGLRLGRAAHRRSADEKESPVAAMGGAILGLVAFMLAFTFGIASSRFDDRKALVRDEARAIETTYLRADFLTEPDRAEVKRLLVEYLEERLALVDAQTVEDVEPTLMKSREIHDRLWKIAVEHGRRELDSDVAALYIDSLNEMVNLHHQRVAVGIQLRIPIGVWGALYALSVLGMIGMGYQGGITGSKRSLASVILALSFALVTSLIFALDRPATRGFRVPQQPLADVRARVAATHGDLPPKRPTDAGGP